MSIKSNINKVIRNTNRMTDDIFKTRTRALNRAIAAAQTAGSKEARKVYNVKAGDIKKVRFIKKASFRRLQAELNYNSTRRSLIVFGARQLKSGTSFKIKKASGRKKLKHSFILNNIKGGRGVFWREMVGGKRAGRLPIIQIKGISVSQMANNKRVGKVIMAVANATYQKRMTHELNRLRYKS